MAESFFPCPICIGTMIPGAQLVFPRPAEKLGAGKVWDLSNGGPRLVDCPRCEGTGKLPDLRNLRNDRRENRDRRQQAVKRTAGG